MDATGEAMESSSGNSWLVMVAVLSPRGDLVGLSPLNKAPAFLN